MVNNTNENWQIIKNKRKDEFKALTYNSKLSAAIDHLGKIAKELDPISGEELRKSLNNLPYDEKILTQKKAQKLIEKSLQELPLKERQLILSNFCV